MENDEYLSPVQGRRLSLSLIDLQTRATGLSSYNMSMASPVFSPTADHDALYADRTVSNPRTDGLYTYEDMDNNTSVDYRRELSKLLAKSKGSSYESTLKRFVDSKYRELSRQEQDLQVFRAKQRQASNIAGLTSSVYDNDYPLNATIGTANHRYSPVAADLGATTSSSVYQHTFGLERGEERGDSIGGGVRGSGGLLRMDSDWAHSYRDGSLEAREQRIEEMAAPLERHRYKGPTSQRVSTNHLGRQRPPPKFGPPSPRRSYEGTSAGVSSYNRPRSASPAAPYPGLGGGEFVSNENGENASVSSSSQRSYSGYGPAGAVTMQEFKLWLEKNQNWNARSKEKVMRVAEETKRTVKDSAKPRINRKSVKLADIASMRLAAAALRNDAASLTLDPSPGAGVGTGTGSGSRGALFNKLCLEYDVIDAALAVASGGGSAPPAAGGMKGGLLELDYVPAARASTDAGDEENAGRGRTESANSLNSANKTPRTSLRSVAGSSATVGGGGSLSGNTDKQQQQRRQQQPEQNRDENREEEVELFEPKEEVLAKKLKEIAGQMSVYDRLALRGKIFAEKRRNWEQDPQFATEMMNQNRSYSRSSSPSPAMPRSHTSSIRARFFSSWGREGEGEEEDDRSVQSRGGYSTDRGRARSRTMQRSFSASPAVLDRSRVLAERRRKRLERESLDQKLAGIDCKTAGFGLSQSYSAGQGSPERKRDTQERQQQRSFLLGSGISKLKIEAEKRTGKFISSHILQMTGSSPPVARVPYAARSLDTGVNAPLQNMATSTNASKLISSVRQLRLDDLLSQRGGSNSISKIPNTPENSTSKTGFGTGNDAGGARGTDTSGLPTAKIAKLYARAGIERSRSESRQRAEQKRREEARRSYLRVDITDPEDNTRERERGGGSGGTGVHNSVRRVRSLSPSPAVVGMSRSNSSSSINRGQGTVNKAVDDGGGVVVKAGCDSPNPRRSSASSASRAAEGNSQALSAIAGGGEGAGGSVEGRFRRSPATSPRPAFSPRLVARRSSEIMSKSSETFADRNARAIETLNIRAEVSLRHPSPGPGHYKKSDSRPARAPSPMFSFSRQPLDRGVDPFRVHSPEHQRKLKILQQRQRQAKARLQQLQTQQQQQQLLQRNERQQQGTEGGTYRSRPTTPLSVSTSGFGVQPIGTRISTAQGTPLTSAPGTPAPRESRPSSPTPFLITTPSPPPLPSPPPAADTICGPSAGATMQDTAGSPLLGTPARGKPGSTGSAGGGGGKREINYMRAAISMNQQQQQEQQQQQQQQELEMDRRDVDEENSVVSSSAKIVVVERGATTAAGVAADVNAVGDAHGTGLKATTGLEGDSNSARRNKDGNIRKQRNDSKASTLSEGTISVSQ